MLSELERGEASETSPFFGREIVQYHVQTVNFRASKKDPSIAEIHAPGPRFLLSSATPIVGTKCEQLER